MISPDNPQREGHGAAGSAYAMPLPVGIDPNQSNSAVSPMRQTAPVLVGSSLTGAGALSFRLQVVRQDDTCILKQADQHFPTNLADLPSVIHSCAPSLHSPSSSSTTTRKDLTCGAEAFVGATKRYD